jgi:SAM-dependent methyltransferase
MQAAYARDRINFLYTFLKTLNGKKMLDVGGSTGVIAKIFKQEFGLIPTIIDPAPLETSRARLLGLETVTGFVEDFEMAKNLYDFIALFQTVDHLMDIARVLEKIHSILDKNGLFFVDIVDFTAAVKRNKSITKSIKIDHPYYLTDNTMRRYLSKFGFEVIQREYASDGLHIGYVCKKHVKL